MVYRLVLLDRFLLIIGSGLILSFIFLVAGGYYLVKLYYYLQMSQDMSRATKIVLKIFLFGMFAPLIVLFLANDMAIPLLASASEEQILSFRAGAGPPLIEHTLNTGALYLVLIGVILLTWLAYYYFKDRKKREVPMQEESLNRIPLYGNNRKIYK